MKEAAADLEGPREREKTNEGVKRERDCREPPKDPPP